MSKSVLSLLPLLVVFAGLAHAEEAVVPAASDATAENQQWRVERLASVTRDSGWLTVVGLHWLQDGDNTFGSAADSNLWQKGAPPLLGTFHQENGKVSFIPAPGVEVQHDEKAIEHIELQPDISGSPTVLQYGTFSFFLIDRGGKQGVRVKDRAAQALAEFQGLDYYAVDHSWRFQARFEPYDPPKPISIANVIGLVSDEPSPGAVVFEHEGKTWRLDALADGDELFLIFGDKTNGRETYGAGRFLYTPAPENGYVTLDFNQAYNPPCAFTAYATCPLPPEQNKLPFRVEAGEKTYGGGHP